MNQTNTKLALLALSLLLTALACASARSAAPASTAILPPTLDPDLPALPLTSRSFGMGTAGFVPAGYPDAPTAQWQALFDHGAAAYGGVYGLHISPTSAANAAGIPEQVQLAFEQMQGVTPYVAFAVTPEDVPFTAARGEQLVAVAVAVAETYQPGIISLGVESNTLWREDPAGYDIYVDYARQAYDAIKAVSPDTQVMNNFQYDRMRGAADLTGEQLPAHWELIDRFAGKLDLISFTVYPFLHYAAVDDIPADYLFDIREHTDLPIMITETGWPTSDTVAGVSGSDEAQIDWLLLLAERADAIGVTDIVWVFPHDAQFGIAGGIFDTISLHHNDGQSKPAFAIWQALLDLPQR